MMLSALMKRIRKSLSDFQQLDHAIFEGRTIFTFNAGDFNRLHSEYLKSGKNHFGIILSKQIPIGETVKRLTKFLITHSREDITNNVYWI